MNRRKFLKGCLAAAAAPAFIKPESLMGLWVPKHNGLTLDINGSGPLPVVTLHLEQSYDANNGIMVERVLLARFDAERSCYYLEDENGVKTTKHDIREQPAIKTIYTPLLV